MGRNNYCAIILIGMLIVASPALAQSNLIEFQEENIKTFRLVKSELAVYFDLNLSIEEISQINEAYGLIPLDEGYAKSHLQVVILPAGSDGKKIRQQLNATSDRSVALSRSNKAAALCT